MAVLSAAKSLELPQDDKVATYLSLSQNIELKSSLFQRQNKDQTREYKIS